VIPAVVPESDVFSDFDALKKALVVNIGEMQAKSGTGQTCSETSDAGRSRG
jgi:hypothetical protein